MFAPVSGGFQTAEDLCKFPAFGAFLRDALLKRLTTRTVCLRVCDTIALNCAQIRGFAKVFSCAVRKMPIGAGE